MTGAVQPATANSIDETNFPHELLLNFESFIKVMHIIIQVIKNY